MIYHPVTAAESVTPKAPWKSRILGHKAKSSQTPGKTKGPTCQTDSMKKFFLCHPHAWKHPQYGEWCRKVRMMNGTKSGAGN